MSSSNRCRRAALGPPEVRYRVSPWRFAGDRRSVGAWCTGDMPESWKNRRGTDPSWSWTPRGGTVDPGRMARAGATVPAPLPTSAHMSTSHKRLSVASGAPGSTDQGDLCAAYPPNVIESPFATVRLRQRVTKGAGSRTKGLLMAFKLLEMAQQRWRRLDGADKLPLVRAGVRFVDGIQLERDDDDNQENRKDAA